METFKIETVKSSEFKFVEGDFLFRDSVVNPDELRRALKVGGVPTSLVSVDKSLKGHNSFTLQAMGMYIPDVCVLTNSEGKCMSVVDPTSTFYGPQEFAALVETLSKVTGIIPVTDMTQPTFTATFEIPQVESDSVLGDLYKRSLTLYRLPYGGVSLNASLLRLACTNGMLVVDKKYSKVFKREVSREYIEKELVPNIIELSVEEYFRSLFSNEGEWFQASVADVMGMRTTLASVTSKEVASEFYPLAPIVEHYEKQGIDIEKMSSAVLNKIPSGLTYYDSFNILTNGAKMAQNIGVEGLMLVSNWAKPSKVNQMKQSSVIYKGMPHFDPAVVSRLKGDIKR